MLFRALPQRDVKPLAKALLDKFGSFAEVIAAPEARLAEVKGLGDAAITELKIVQAAASRLLRGAGEEAAGAVVLVDACSTIAAPRRPSPTREQFRVLFLDKRNQLIADELQQVGTVDHTPVYPREVVKRALELSATAHHPGAQSSVRRPDAVARRHPDDASRSSRWRSRSAFPCTTTSSSARKGTPA